MNFRSNLMVGQFLAFLAFLFSCRQINAELMGNASFCDFMWTWSFGYSSVVHRLDSLRQICFPSFLAKINQIRCSMHSSIRPICLAVIEKFMNIMKISWHLWICSAPPVEISRSINIELLHHLWHVICCGEQKAIWKIWKLTPAHDHSPEHSSQKKFF